MYMKKPRMHSTDTSVERLSHKPQNHTIYPQLKPYKKKKCKSDMVSLKQRIAIVSVVSDRIRNPTLKEALQTWTHV